MPDTDRWSGGVGLDPVTFSVVRGGFRAAALDMYSAFRRTAMLPILYEFNDFGMALFDDRLDSALMPKAATSVANVFAFPYLALVRRLLAGQPRPGGGHTEVPRR